MQQQRTAAAIVLAGGSGSRFGAGSNKVFLPLGGRPIIAWSVAVLAARPEVAAVVLVVRQDDRDAAAALVADGQCDGRPARGPDGREGPVPPVELVIGGGTRQESELAGLRQLAERISDGRVRTVLVHDGARPLVSDALVERVLRTAERIGGAVPGLPCPDLVAVSADDSGRVLDRPAGPLHAVQTPQGFRAGPLLAAYRAAAEQGFAGTDTASCVARFAPGLAVRLVDGDPRNFKITYAHDLAVAEAVCAGTVR